MIVLLKVLDCEGVKLLRLLIEILNSFVFVEKDIYNDIIILKNYLIEIFMVFF